MEVSSCANWESYSFNNSVSFVSICCFSLWQGALKMSGLTFSAIILFVVILCIVGAPGFAGDCGFSSSITSMVGSRWPTYSPLLKCDMLIGVIWHENIHWCFSFDVIYAICNIYIGILSFCWVMINDENMSFNCVSFDLDQDDAIMSRWYFESWLDNSYCCLLVLSFKYISEKSDIYDTIYSAFCSQFQV